MTWALAAIWLLAQDAISAWDPRGDAAAGRQVEPAETAAPIVLGYEATAGGAGGETAVYRAGLGPDAVLEPRRWKTLCPL